MSRILHLCWGLAPTNGATNIARMIMGEQVSDGGGRVTAEIKSWLTVGEIRQADEIWCHCGWYYGIWWAVLWAKIFHKRLHWVPECCYDPVRLAYHGWKKRLVGPFERWALRQCDEIVATCPAEETWIRAYEPRVKRVVLSDIKRFFRFTSPTSRHIGSLHILYLGRPHPLKGTDYLKAAVKDMDGVELRLVSDHSGEELARDWEWADVLCLPTLSDNFGLVIAEALSRGVPVITTDGAPAWDPAWTSGGPEPWRDHVIYLSGYRTGSDATRVQLLKTALAGLQGLK